eukprot:847291_1
MSTKRFDTLSSLNHGILSCPNERYTEDRQTMIDTVKSAFLLHLDDIEQMPEKKRPRVDKIAKFMDKPVTPDTDPKDLYLKQFIYPSYQLSKKRRLDIFRAVMFYLINARPEIIERIKDKLCKKYVPGATFEERRITHLRLRKKARKQ